VLRNVSHISCFILFMVIVLMINAPQTGRTVSMQNLEDAFYRDHFVKVGRLVH